MFSMRSEGGAELAKALASLSTRVSKKVLISALTDGAEPIRKDTSTHIARRSPKPDIADNIVVSPVRASRTEDQAAVAVGPASGFAYGLPLELGTVHMQAQPSLRPAFDANVEKSLGIVGDSIWTELAGRGINRPTAVEDADVQAPGGSGLL